MSIAFVKGLSRQHNHYRRHSWAEPVAPAAAGAGYVSDTQSLSGARRWRAWSFDAQGGGTKVNERGTVMALRHPSFARVISLGLLLLAIGAEAQQPARTYRIAYLSSASAIPPNGLEPFRQGLREFGYVEGRNVLILERFAENRLDRLPELAADLVRLKADIIVTFSTPAARAASQATTTIPVVMSSGGDPVGSGLVTSLGYPGGNVTGFTHLAGPEMWAKVLEFLKEIAPHVSRVAVLRNSAIPPEARGF